MESLGAFGGWIAANEALLSGMVSLVVLTGLVLSPFGKGVRRLFAARDRDAPASRSAPPAASDEPLLAVLAFDNLSNDEEMQFFSDGVSEELIQRLSRGAKLKVVGRTSSFQFRGERKALAADQLACSHVLDGSVRRAGGRVRISAHLVEVGSRTTLWSERFDRDLEDVFAVQDEIGDRIAAALDRTFSGSATRSVDPEVYDLYLRGRPHSYAPDELGARIALLEEVTRRAPHFAEAWGRLAYLRAWWRWYQPYRGRAAIADRVREEADRALAVDPHDFDALAARVFVVPAFGHFAESDRALDRLRNAPGSGHGRLYVGYVLRATGHVREGLEDNERVHRLDAFDPMASNALALSRMAAGRLDEAAPLYEDLVQRVPEMGFPVANLLRLYAFQGDWNGVDRLLAIAERRELRGLEDGLAFVRAKRSPAEHLDAWRSAFDADVRGTGCVDVARLVYAAHLGLLEEAYRAAGSAWLGPTGGDGDLMGPDAYRTSLLFQQGMPELRNDPRFVPLCARLGLVGYWLESGRWPDCADEVPYDFRAECERARGVLQDDFAARL